MVGKSDPILRCVLGTALLLTAGLSAMAAEPVRGRSSELGIRFELEGGSNWCNADVIVRLGAERTSIYQPEGAPFLRMVGRIRAIIHDQCTKVERILFVGFAKGQKEFAAEMTKLTRWRRFINLDPDTETPACTPASPNDSECDKRTTAYATVMQLMNGPAFADVELTSVMEERTDLHVAWQARESFGSLKISHRSEGRHATSAAVASANAEGVAEACAEDGGQVSRIPAADYGEVIAFRSILCRRPGKPSRLNIVLVKADDAWFYLFSLWGEEPHMAPANTVATALAEALAAVR